ncbi:MAG TPA: M20/M25/M40 family metallo-hydrolase [Caulobacterales bacterium]|nr:M20/M25/M40 family metallo-hydrolase [Caulobacterales bacterium]
MRGLAFVFACAVLGVASASAQPAQVAPAPINAEMQRTIDRLREAGLKDDNAFAIVQDLVSRIGPRQAGTEAEARARDWAVAMLRAHGFANPRIEDFTIPSWDATVETAEIVAPARQRLLVAALGGSPSTPPGGLEAEVVRFPSLEALQAAPTASVRGKIVFIDEGMTRTQDGSGYGVAVRKRGMCQPLAQAKEAAACLIRSVSTDASRFPHQGGSSRQRDNAHLPAAALAVPDADVLAYLLSRGPVRVRLNIEATMQDAAPSGNVLAEIPGRDRGGEIVLAVAHLDSWDLGFGAIDDGAGVAIVTAAAKLIRDLPRRPRRTIRILLAGSEEIGGNGGKAYAEAHRNDTHIVAAESDFGADRVWRVQTRFGAGALPYARALQLQLAPLGVNPGDNNADPGTDVDPVKDQGVPVITLNQDGSRYFDVHHTANDTLDRIDPQQLRQNVAAWAVFLYMAADSDWDFRAAQ